MEASVLILKKKINRSTPTQTRDSRQDHFGCICFIKLRKSSILYNCIIDGSETEILGIRSIYSYKHCLVCLKLSSKNKKLASYFKSICILYTRSIYSIFFNECTIVQSLSETSMCIHCRSALNTFISTLLKRGKLNVILSGHSKYLKRALQY